MKSPCRFKELIPAIACQLLFDLEFRWVSKFETTGKLPKNILHIAASVGKEIMAFSLTLRPITQVVYMQYAEWTRHSDKNANIYERSFEPFGALKSFVNHHAVHSRTMSDKQRKICQDATHEESAP